MPLITIIAPCYNESETVISFLESLEPVLSSLPYSFRVVMVNDGSADDTLQLLDTFQFRCANALLHTISLEENCGHQAAIMQGFLHAMPLACDHFIVMDADGQDAPAVIPMLLEHRQADVVHVVRSRRSEPVFFRLSYYCYRLMFRLITGRQMNFGNFCLISRPVMEQAVNARFTHLAAFLSRQQCKKYYLAADRGARIGGKSKMGFRKLVRHALLSFSEYGYRPQLRLFKRAVSR